MQASQVLSAIRASLTTYTIDFISLTLGLKIPSLPLESQKAKMVIMVIIIIVGPTVVVVVSINFALPLY